MLWQAYNRGVLRKIGVILTKISLIKTKAGSQCLSSLAAFHQYFPGGDF